jgi:hypothetical protein
VGVGWVVAMHGSGCRFGMWDLGVWHVCANMRVDSMRAATIFARLTSMQPPAPHCSAMIT